MKCYMLWHGGSSYACFDQFRREDIDECASLKEARELFESRTWNQIQPSTPCVEDCTPEDGGPEAWICFENPFEVPDLYPDRILSYGPRGGLHMTLA